MGFRRKACQRWGRIVLYLAASLLILSTVRIFRNLSYQESISFGTRSLVNINHIPVKDDNITKNSANAVKPYMRQKTTQGIYHSNDSHSIQEASHKPFLFGQIIGRLGNEIFQYVAQYIIAKKTGRLNLLDPKTVLHRVFGNIKGVQTNRDVWKSAPHNTVFEEAAGIYSEQMLKEVTNTEGNIGICCYFQSWRYMEGYEEEVRDLLSIHSEGLEKVDHYIHQQATVILETQKQTRGTSAPLTVHDFTYIGVHVRKADMSLTSLQTRGYANAPVSYILKAIQFYRDRYKHPLFFIASDNLSWCKENLRTKDDDFVFVSYRSMSDTYDFITLVRCNHTVITSGSFGWWIGWLSQGTVVYYSGFPKPDTEIGRQYKAEDYYPPKWIPMT